MSRRPTAGMNRLGIIFFHSLRVRLLGVYLLHEKGWRHYDERFGFSLTFNYKLSSNHLDWSEAPHMKWIHPSKTK